MDEKVYTGEEVLAALSSLQNQYYNEQLNVLMRGVPQLVERLRECEAAFHTAPDSREALARTMISTADGGSYAEIAKTASLLREHGGGSD